MNISVVFAVFLHLFAQVFSANVLFLSGVASPSHHIYNRAFVIGLAKTHNVTFVSSDEGKPHPNVHYIHLEKVYSTLYGGDEFDILDLATQTNPYEQWQGFRDYIIANCDGILASDGLQAILNYPDDFKFDVVLHDFTGDSCLLPLIHKFKYPPLIAVTAFSNPPYSIFTIGGQKYPGFIPHYLLDYETKMTFAQRIYNMYVYAIELV